VLEIRRTSVGYLSLLFPAKQSGGLISNAPVIRDESFEKALKRRREIGSRGRKENTVFPLPDPLILNGNVTRKS